MLFLKELLSLLLLVSSSEAAVVSISVLALDADGLTVVSEDGLIYDDGDPLAVAPATVADLAMVTDSLVKSLSGFLAEAA